MYPILLKWFQHGVDSSITTYGQTGSGKTYTMEKCIPYIFSDALEFNKKFDYILTFSMVEIHNNLTKDLLDSKTKFFANVNAQQFKKEMKEIRKIEVKDTETIMKIYKQSINLATKHETAMNRHSSRSHVISILRATKDQKSSQLFITDLAGSENCIKSNTSGGIY